MNGRSAKVFVVDDAVSVCVALATARIQNPVLISRSIIEAHGGRLWAERRVSGATFTFTVPAASAASAASNAIAV